MDQTSSIHTMDTRFIYVIFKLSFSKQYNIQRFNRLCYRLMVNNMKESFAQQSIFATPSANPMK